jgi:hypothetical protein
LIAPSLVIGIAAVLVGLGAAALIDLVAPAAEALLTPDAYLEAVNAA